MKEKSNLVTLMVSCFVIVGCIGQPSVPETSSPSESVMYQNPHIYRVVFIVTVHNQGYAVDKLEVWQARPLEWDSQKNIQIEEVSPSPTNEGSDPVYGNGIYHWRVVHGPKQGESLPFKIQFIFTAYETITAINPDHVQPYNKKDPDYTLYTQSERFIEADDPEIVNTANKIGAGETNPYLLARTFYDFVVDTVAYERRGEGLRGAKKLLTTGKGECGDFSALFVALCRAKGIPARPVVGYWAKTGLDNVHVWAEFYIEPFGWIPVDLNVGQFISDKKEYYFGNMDNERVILHKGYNIPLNPPLPNGSTAEHLQTPHWWFWGSGNIYTMRIERTTWTVTTLFPSPSLF
jgi:hypothetical protein